LAGAFRRRNSHNAIAWAWINNLAPDDRLLFSRYTQIGLLRLLTNKAVMGDQTLTLGQAWAVYDQWLADPRVEFCSEPRQVEESFRLSTEPFAVESASKWVGDCWLLAFAQAPTPALSTSIRHCVSSRTRRSRVTPPSGPAVLPK